MAKTSSAFKISCLLAITLTATLYVGTTNALAETYQYTIEAGSYKIVDTANGYQAIEMDGFGQLLEPGQPKLPSRIFAIGIPPGVSVESVEVVGDAMIELPGTYQIIPAPMVSSSDVSNEDIEQIRTEYNCIVEQAYSTDAAYPDTAGDFISQGGYRKYNLVQVRFSPFQFLAKSGRLFYYPSATINANYRSSPSVYNREGLDAKSPGVIGDWLPEVEERASEILVNFDEARNWFPAPAEGEDDATGGLYEFVIVTTDALVDAVQPLVDWEKSKGKTVYVATTSWIDANYSGADLARRIRYFLHYKYPSTEWGITDVCLVGNLTDVPMRYCFGEGPTGTPIPTDLYYAELTYIDSLSWDYDWDGFLGEQADDVIDFIKEVNVARIPWSDPATVESICRKMATFEYSNDMIYKDNYLLTGAFSYSDTDNAVLKNYIIEHELDPDTPPIRIYEQGPCWDSSYDSDYDLSPTITREVWGGTDGPFGFVNLAGHGNAYSVFYKERHETCVPEAYFSDGDTIYLDDAHPAIVFSNACSTAYPELIGLGRSLLKEGAVAFVGGTRGTSYAHGWQDPSDGWSQTLDWLFTHHAVSYNENHYSVGESHQIGLLYMYSAYNWDNYWKHMFTWNIYGNPDLRLANRPTALPNLDYLYRYGWDYPIVPRSAGYASGNLCPLTSTLPGNSMDTYYNFTWENNGTIDAPLHRTRLYVDEKLLFTSQPTLNAGASIYHTNIQSGSVVVPGGRHTLYYYLDEDEQVWEVHEGDNCWGRQFVWSPYALVDDTPLNRDAPPHHAAWGCVAGVWDNNDGFSFDVQQAHPDKWWSAVGILPYNAAADFDMKLWDRGDYTGSEQGFGGGYLEYAAGGPGASDFILVNDAYMPSGTYYAGVINANDQTGNYHIEEATSTKIESGSNGPYAMSSTAVLDIYECPVSSAGDYGFRLEQVAGTCNLGMSLYDDETPYCKKSEYMAGGYANSSGDGGNEFMQVTIPDSGWHALVVWKAGAGDYSKTADYRVKMGQCTTPGTPANPYPPDGAASVSINTDLNWDDCTDTEYYEVWLKEGSGSWVKLGETETSAWMLPTLNGATFYEWQIRAHNICGSDTYAYWEFTTEAVDPPVIDDIAFDACISECPTCPDSHIVVTAHDPAGWALSYAWTPLNGGTILGAGATVDFDPPDSGPHPCPYQVSVTVTSYDSGLSTEATLDIAVKLTGDANGDGVVNILDKVAVRNAFGTGCGDLSFDPLADVNCDCVVNILDKVMVRNQFGQSGCECP